MSKSKAVKSRDAGEPSLEDAKKQFAAKGKAATKEVPVEDAEVVQPTPGESIVEAVQEAPAAPAKAPESAAGLAPKVAKKRKRSDRDYKISSHAEVMNQGVSVGDVGAIEEVVNWAIVTDTRVMIRGRVCVMRAGQVVNRVTHDLENLRTMGVVLKRVR